MPTTTGRPTPRVAGILSTLLSLFIASGIITSTLASSDTTIEYWTNYAIYPKRCVKYNNNDQIMYAIYEKAANHCVDTPTGTYVASVPTFVNAYLGQAADNAAEAGEEYTYPTAADYLDCTLKEIDGTNYYIQLGCSDYDSEALAVNIYSDAQCTVHSTIDGYDDSNLAVDFTITFDYCIPCVTWYDKNDDAIDDQYYTNHQMYAPLCSAMWEYKQTCDTTCQKMGAPIGSREGWNKADKVLLSILSLFGFGMLLAIIKKRTKMSNKDALLEQAAITSVGLQQSHVLGIFALLVLIITIFGLLGLKKITWALLLILNIVLFAYLMKLTLDSSVKETVVGPDGKIMEIDDDSDEDDDDDDDPTSPVTEMRPGEYKNPTLADKAIV